MAPKKKAVPAAPSPLEGKNIVFTGKLSTLTRAEATAKATAAGAKVTTAVSGKTNIVVVGDTKGLPTNTSASVDGDTCQTWTEEQFLKAVDGEVVVAAPPAPVPAKTTPKKKALEEPEAADEPPKKAAKTETTPTVQAAAAATTKAAAGGGGGRVVDREVPSRESYKVHDDWTVKLNQTNVDGNNNKFYIIQMLTNGNGNFFAWNRWGRIGEPGQNKLESCGTFAAAKSSFEKKYKDKTGNDWSNRSNFVSKPGKYTIVETEEDGGDGDSAAPMGKLSKAQIEKGQAVLADLLAAIEGNKKSVLNELSSRFFTLIPTNFGRQRPDPITTTDKVHEKEELLKFYLRMGFEDMEKSDKKITPISGVMDLAVPPTLKDAIGNACDDGSIKKSVSQGETLAKKQAGGPLVPMTKEHYGSIMLYTSNAIYRDLNKVLREENRLGVQKYLRYLRLLLHSTDLLPKKNVTLWRGISVDLSGQYTVGSTITWWGVSSCTSDQQVARNFMNGCGGDCSFLTIDTKTAVDISQITFYSNEKESLLLPGTQLLVKSVKKVGKVAEIHLEEVGRLLS